jgi:KDO2-lipid IV(A) lauroyltransferase
LLKYLVFWFVFRVLGLLPLPALYWIADVVAAIGFRVARGSREAVLANLRHVLPDADDARLREVAKQSFRSVAYYYADLAHLPRLDPKRFLEERLDLHGVHERLLPTVHSGSGAIMLSGHFGNPEFVLQAVLPLGIRGAAVTEPVQPPRLARMMNEIRSTHGVEFMPVGVSGVKRMIQTIRSGGAIALMGDRDIEGPRMRLPFFGREAWMPTGPIELGLRTGVPVFPSFCWRRNRYRIEAFLEEPIEVKRTDDFQADVRAAALIWIARFEHYLREDPGQWFVLERIWDEEAADSPNREQPPIEVPA